MNRKENKENIILGVIGRAGSGKSYAVEVFRKHYPLYIIDLDKIGHQILTLKKVKKTLITHFGDLIINDKEEINRSELAKIVFNDKQKLDFLNQLVHPLIRKRVSKIIKENKKESIVIVGALLYEIKLDSYCNNIIVIDATDDLIKKMNPKKFYITKLQKSRGEFLKRGDASLKNDYTKVFNEKCIRFINKLKRQQKRNYQEK